MRRGWENFGSIVFIATNFVETAVFYISLLTVQKLPIKSSDLYSAHKCELVLNSPRE